MDHYHQMLVVLSDNGIELSEALNTNGLLNRYHNKGDKLGSKNLAVIAHLDENPTLWAYNFKTGQTIRWSASGKPAPFTQAMRQQIEADKAKRLLEQQARHDTAAIKARDIWAKSEPVTEHQYLINKRIKPHCAKLYRGSLVIPIINSAGELVNLQFIGADGSKKFLTGGKKKRCFSLIGKYRNINPILLCEGFATGASLHQATGFLVFVALDAGNLEAVSKTISSLYHQSQIIVCSDNDVNLVGQQSAIAAVIACGGSALVPKKAGNDWNDVLSTMEGE